ncbi:MAG: hypothetical protein EZS28_018451, partial [Streblomastix strix]
GSTIAIISKDPEDIEFIDIDGYQKRIVKKKDDYYTISLSQVLYDGIWQLETMFQVEEDEDTLITPDYSGGVNHIEYYSYGNTSFKENQSSRLEFDSDKGTLVLFIDDVQQPVYISGIKEKVRFITTLTCHFLTITTSNFIPPAISTTLLRTYFTLFDALLADLFVTTQAFDSIAKAFSTI